MDNPAAAVRAVVPVPVAEEVDAVVAVEDAVVVVVSSDWTTLSSHLPRLGVGLGYRDVYQSDVFRNQSSIDFLELVADHFFDPTPVRQRQKEILQSHFPLIPHGLALSLGSADGLDEAYLALFAKLVTELDPPWWSEHIAFTRAGGIDIGHLTSLPKTSETLETLRRNIAKARSIIAKPLILENITETIRYPGQQLEDSEFLNALLEENDCGLLLDVTNLYANSVNYRFDPLQVLWRLPRDRIIQLHFVGGHWENGLFVDSHSSQASEEIWDLLKEVLKYAPVKGIILERDENFPPIEELLNELNRARECFHSSQLLHQSA